MRHTQRGITFLGWVILLIPVALVVYCAIRLTPDYLNYMRVAHSLDRLAAEAKVEESTTAQSLRGELDRSFDIEIIQQPTVQDIDIHRDGDHWVAIADYDDQAPLFGNLSLLVHFHKEVQVQ